jgi:dihydrolipoamide dehydrogenase
VVVTGRDGATTELVAERAVVIATGSSTIEVPGFEFDGTRVIGAREAVSLRAVPRRLLVIGGGVIGLELGGVYQALGAELTVVELMPTLLPGVDPECVQVVERRLRKRGAAVLTRTKALAQRLTETGIAVDLELPDGPRAVEVDVVLVAVGMRPRSRDLGRRRSGWPSTRAASSPPTSAARPTCRGSTPSGTSAGRRCSPTRPPRRARSAPR